MKTVIGVDEVGRGCWAGPLVAGAVLFSPKSIVTLNPLFIQDSKKLTSKQRTSADAYIRQHTNQIGLGWVYPNEIDRLGLSKSVQLAMERAVKQITVPYDEIIIDGNFNFLISQLNSRALIKADSTVAGVSAASIVAKVARDNYMISIAKDYPEYGFEKHVGYGTKQHLDRLKIHGPCLIHRQSFKPIKLLNSKSDSLDKI